jgi:hypothetical protein
MMHDRQLALRTEPGPQPCRRHVQPCASPLTGRSPSVRTKLAPSIPFLPLPPPLLLPTPPPALLYSPSTPPRPQPPKPCCFKVPTPSFAMPLSQTSPSFPSLVKGFRSIFVSKPPPPLTTVGFFALPGQALPLDPKHFRFNLDDLHCSPRPSSLPTHFPPSVNLHPSILFFSFSLPPSLLLCLLPRSVPLMATTASNPSSS